MFDDVPGITRLCFSSDGLVLAAGNNDGSIALLDVDRGTSIRRLEGHTSWIYALAFTPDAKSLASTSYDGTIKLWSVATGQAALTLKHIGPVTSVCCSKNGMLMATAGADATVKLWPAVSLSEADASLHAVADGSR